MNIATRIIEAFDGPANVSEVTGASISRVYRWTYGTDRGGTGGRVPQKHWASLLAAAKSRGIPLTLDDLYGGKP